MSRNIFITCDEFGLSEGISLAVIELHERALASTGGLTPQAYHLASGARIREAINRAWNRRLAAWATCQSATIAPAVQRPQVVYNA